MYANMDFDDYDDSDKSINVNATIWQVWAKTKEKNVNEHQGMQTIGVVYLGLIVSVIALIDY